MATPLVWYAGVAQFNLQRQKEAFDAFEQACRQHPYHLHVLNNLASSYELQGNHEKASEYYKQALTISPHFEDALVNLSIVYYNQERYRAASELLANCDPESDNPKLQRVLTMLQEKIKGETK
jgi:tetratricopeptide (TPR) repeat protein